MATVGFIIFVDRVFVEKVSGIIHPIIVGISWIVCPYFEGLVFLSTGVLILLMMILFLDIVLIYPLGDPVPRRVVPFLRSHVDDRYIGRDIIDIYYFNFLIGIFLNLVALLSVF